MRETLHKVLDSSGFTPITLLYLSSAGVLMLGTSNALSLIECLTVLAFLSVLAMLAVTLNELRKVHKIVNSQHTALVVRIEQLTRALNTQGAIVPDVPDALPKDVVK